MYHKKSCSNFVLNGLSKKPKCPDGFAMNTNDLAVINIYRSTVGTSSCSLTRQTEQPRTLLYVSHVKLTETEHKARATGVESVPCTDP